MSDFTSKLLSKILLIFEMEGLEGVENYARANRLPMDVCRRLLIEHGILTHQGVSLDAGSRPHNPAAEGRAQSPVGSRGSPHGKR